MLSNIQRIRIYASVLIVAVILTGIGFNYTTALKLKDVELLNDVRSLSLFIERHKQEYWQYPAGELLDVRGDVYLTENGFAPGYFLLYIGKISSKRPVTYQATEDGYRLVFTLRTTWPDRGIFSKKCQIESTSILTCGDEIY